MGVRSGPAAAEFTDSTLDVVRESYSHRRWPPEVVSAFSRAEVVRARVEPGEVARRPRLYEIILSAFGHFPSLGPTRRPLP